MQNSEYHQSLTEWEQREAVAEAMIPLIGKLYRECNVVISIYARPLISRSDITIIKAHRFVRQVEEQGLSVHDTFPLLQCMAKMKLSTARIDLGKLTIKYKTLCEEGKDPGIEGFLQQELKPILQHERKTPEPKDVVLYGFGRIGRLLTRILIEKTGGGGGLRLRAIVVRKTNQTNDLTKRASLLRRDSVHGSFHGTITVDEENNMLIANGNRIHVIYADAPDQIDYTQHGITDAIIIDNTGVWRDEAGLSQHLKSKGVSRVLLTAPGKGEVKNIVQGINQHDINDKDLVVSAASCTTNAIVPVLKAMNDEFGIAHGHVETVHSYTNDQNLIDNYHKGDRRGRSAPLNMVITETGAASAVAKALPELSGKLTGNAIRVPTPNVSLAILNLTLDKATTLEEVNEYLRYVALHSDLQKQVDFTNSPEAVSSDFVGSRYAGVVDAEATIVKDGCCVLYVWYDNEFGYSCQVVRLVQHIAGINYVTLPVESK